MTIERQMMSTAVTLSQIQQQLATVANNIANVGTTGYKSRNATFSDLLVQSINNITPGEDAIDKANRLTPDGIRVGSGAKVGDTQLDTSEGTLEETGDPLDMALTNDQQYFTVRLNGATAYTRAGDFNTEPDGTGQLRLLTKNGQAVLGADGQPIDLPSGYKSLAISSNGSITATMPNGAEVAAGRLGIVQISRPQLLQSQGNALYTLPNLANLGVGLNQVAQLATNGSVVQGKLEGSNVNLTDEMTNLIDLERNYQMNAQSITMSDQMSGLINGLLQ
ncbi:MAG: flagellar hook-basal body protein [Sporolactobacillus sp.]